MNPLRRTVRPAAGRSLLLMLIAALLLAACGGTPEPVSLRLGAAPWLSGEQSTYAVADNASETSGSARYDVSGDGASWTFRREVSALGNQEVAIIETGAEGYRPQASTVVRTLAEGAVEQVRTVYTQGVADLELTTRQNVTTVQRFNIPTDARDQRTIPFLVRTLPLAEGYATRINAFLPLTGTLDRYTVSVMGRETVEVAAGAFDAWRVRLEARDNISHLWVGVEAPFPIVKFDDGRVNATYELQTFTPGG